MLSSFHLLVLATKMQFVSPNIETCEGVLIMFYVFVGNDVITWKPFKDINRIKIKCILKPTQHSNTVVFFP